MKRLWTNNITTLKVRHIETGLQHASKYLHEEKKKLKNVDTGKKMID